MNNRWATLSVAFIIALLGAEISLAMDKHAGQAKVTVSAQRQTISAKLVDEGVYFYRPNGAKVTLLRKQGVYLMRPRTQSRATRISSQWQVATSQQTLKRLNARYAQRLRQVNTHRFGAGATVIKVDNQNKAFMVNARMIKAADSAIDQLLPVFANAQGHGDIALLPGVTIALHANANVTRSLTKLQADYSLQLKRRLTLTGQVYSFAFKQTQSAAQQLATVRAIMQRPDTQWAEPQLHSLPYKTVFEPNDTLFDQQWHLRNTGQQGGRCDADCDANNAWDLDLGSGASNGTGAVTGAGTIIAVIDDGVQLNHPDLNVNTADDKDFVNDTGVCGNDGTAGPDNDASPNASTGCMIQGEAIQEDNHGTAVAGIAAAVGNNNLGVAGVAYNATILPIRAISDYNATLITSNGFCTDIAEAMEYAGQHADVINNSWAMDVPCTALENAITKVVNGTIMDGGNNVSHRPNKGSPVVFSSGNNGSGWLKITIDNITDGEHHFEWRFLRAAFASGTVNDDTVWLDDISWPGSSGVDESFESDLGELTSDCALNTCNDFCTVSDCNSAWTINTNLAYTRSGTQSAMANLSGVACDYTYLHTTKTVPAGSLSFWVWVSTETEGDQDRFELLIDGQEVVSFGDLPAVVHNQVAYPASLSSTIDGVIAVGASNDGDLSGNVNASHDTEQRAYYSQYGVALDVLAPSSNQHQLITTTDRTGNDGYNGLSDLGYTDLFTGTSAAAPIVSGIAAAMIAVNDSLTAQQIRAHLRQTADKIGPLAYVDDGSGKTRNDFYGYGRVNMAKAVQLANGDTPTDPGSDTCNSNNFSFTDFAAGGYQPQSTEFCPGQFGQDDELCLPIKAANNNVAVICL